MVAYDEGHLVFRMLFKVVKLPWMEVSYEVAIVSQHAPNHGIVQPLGQIVQRQPKQRKAQKGRNRSGDLHHLTLHKPTAGCGEVHITPWNESWIERRVIQIASLGQCIVAHGEHTGLPITMHRHARHTFKYIFRPPYVFGNRLPMVHSMTSHLVSLVHDAANKAWSLLGKVARAEESGANAIRFQTIENARSTFYRHTHALFQADVYAMLARNIKLFGVET